MDSGSQHEDAEYAWHLLLESHRHPDGEPNATIEIAYEAGQVNLERYARSFQSVALLEALSDYVSSQLRPAASDQDGHGELR